MSERSEFGLRNRKGPNVPRQARSAGDRRGAAPSARVRRWRFDSRLLRSPFGPASPFASASALSPPERRKTSGSAVPAAKASRARKSKAALLAEATRIAADWGYDEINLNVGCPSDRVQNNMIGACLMGHPEKVAAAVKAMQAAVSIPVTVKCRIGIDDQDEDADLARFIDIVASAGCSVFTVHARKAWLQGLSPKENRDIPPLNYPRVHRLKQSHPELHIGINGGIKTLDECQAQLEHVDSVMVGREAYQSPWLLAGVDEQLFGEPGPARTRLEAATAFRPYIQQRLDEGAKLNHITRHLLGLFQGCPGGRRFRRHLSEHAHKEGAGLRLFDDALGLVREPETDTPPVEEQATKQPVA